MARALLPREHGAYVQLGIPLVAALVGVGVTPAAMLLAIAACLAFLANEPLLVVLGHRGRRLQASAGVRARHRLIVLGIAAAGCGFAGLALASRDTLAIAAIVAAPAIVLVAFAWARAERTVAGETIAALTLTGAAAPVAVAAGLPWREAVVLWAAWTIGYATTVVAIQRVIARHKRTASWIDGAATAALATVALASIAAWSHPFSSVAAPIAAISSALVISPPRATRLRAVGFALLGASTIAGALAVWSLRT